MQEIEEIEELKEVVDDIIVDEKNCEYYIYRTNIGEALYINEQGKLITQKEYNDEKFKSNNEKWKIVNLNRNLDNINKCIEDFKQDNITVNKDELIKKQDKSIEEKLTDWFQEGIYIDETKNIQDVAKLIQNDIKNELLKEIVKTIKSESSSDIQDMFILEIPHEYVSGEKILFQKSYAVKSKDEIHTKMIPSEFLKSVILTGREEIFNNFNYKSEHIYIEPVKEDELFTIIQSEDITNIISYMYEEVNSYGNQMYVDKLNSIKQKILKDNEQVEMLEKVNELLDIEDRKTWSEEKWKTYNFAMDLEKIENTDFSKLDSEKISGLVREFITEGSEILSNEQVRSDGLSNEVLLNYKQGMTLLNDKSIARKLEGLTNIIQEKINEIDNYYNYMVQTENVAFAKGIYNLEQYENLDTLNLDNLELNDEDKEMLKNRIIKINDLKELMIKNPYEYEEEKIENEFMNSILENEYKKAGITEKDIEAEFNLINNNENTDEKIEEESKI